MADGWTYSQWVVGNSRMRAVDPHWSDAGSTIHHSIGGCRIEMSEVPASAPLSWLPDSVGLASAFPRNRECTWRLAALAERRQAEHQ
jgi:hypothetical protein